MSSKGVQKFNFRAILLKTQLYRIFWTSIYYSFLEGYMNPFLRKLSQPQIRERILREKLSEPLHMILFSLFAGIFGSFETKVYFDLVVRPHNAFCLLEAARNAHRRGYKSFTAIEFGVANGAGLINMAKIAEQVTRATGIGIELVGFDNAVGMPPCLDYRDHPELYQPHDFPMQNYEGLLAQLPPTAKLILGNVSETTAEYLKTVRPECPIGYVVLDVDYYSSSVAALKVFDGASELYLPETLMYLDDISTEFHNPWQGEYLAVNEFNEEHAMRKICPYNMLREKRLFKGATWIGQVYFLHVLDHILKSSHVNRKSVILGNPYLDLPSAG